MKKILSIAALCTGLGFLFWLGFERPVKSPLKSFTLLQEDDEEKEHENSEERARYEWLLTRDPRTGLIPYNIRAREIDLAEKLPQTRNSSLLSPLVSNPYSSAGPTQNGGRTRVIVFDRRYNGSSNKIILAGGITGGIFRSADGGGTWKFVHPANEIRSVSTIAQDPTSPDTWYAGTGEPIGASAGYPNAFVFGNGMFKSTDNGVTWTKLSSTNVDDPTSFSSQWSFVHKIAVHPTTGHVYAAIHRRVVRSTDGGVTWTEVFGSSITSTSIGGIADIIFNNAGTKMYLAMSGRNADRSLAGIFTSGTGSPGSFTRIAGGVKDAADSVAGWRAYSTSATAGWGKIILALAPSNQNLLYALVENSDDAAKSLPEADLFKCNLTNMTWTKHTDSLVAKRIISSGTTKKYLELQGGYNMVLAIHPTKPETVIVGGVNLYRSTDGFSTIDNVTFIGGLTSTTYTESDPQNPVSHVDFHTISFDPSDPNKLMVGDDGGIQYIKDVTVPSPVWFGANNQYQTIQYYHVGIDPTAGSRTFYGGAQDNSTTLRDRSGILGSLLPDSNDHYIVLGGDGCQVGMTKKNTEGKQHLFCAAQNGQIYRMNLFAPFDANSLYTKIKPTGTGDGIFITYFHLDQDNTDNLYYATKDSIYRTKNSTTVTSSTWTLMDGVAPKVNGDIYAMETTKGPYSANSHLFIGSSAGRVYRLKDPQNTSTSTAPDDITPTGMQSGSVVKDISVNPRNQDTMLVVVSNYNVNSIFWTGNATATSPTWQVIDGNIDLPSIRACKVVVKTTGVEYYVGTTVGLYSTTQINGASTVWSRETGVAGTTSEMLNTAIVNSLAYRWADNTFVVGTHGNGMFATSLGNAITLTTAITEPVRNNTDFVRNLYPTITKDRVNYQVGNLYSTKKISVQVTSLSGAMVMRNETGYTNGQVDLSSLPAGMYIITITSPDRKYQFTKKVIKN